MKKTVLVCIKNLFLICGVLNFSIFADEFHNINGFFGERAAGMGGAFSAISDDVTGAFYNPAGLGYITNNSYTINASTYQSKELKNQDFFGPNQNYNQSSRNYLPNFMGFAKRVDKFTFAFTILTKINEAFDQSERVQSPLYNSKVSQLDVSLFLSNFNLLAGPSIGYAISSKFSVGMSLLGDYTSSRLLVNSTEVSYSNTIQSNNINEKKITHAFSPIIGFQFMPFKKLSLGLSLRKNYVFDGKIDRKLNSSSTFSTSQNVYQGSEYLSATVIGSNVIVSDPLTYRLPEVFEIRTGFAYFLNSRFLFTADVIYNSNYRKYMANSAYSLSNNVYNITDPYQNDLLRQKTLNFAGGFEFFLTDTIVLRMGYLTNRANSRKISWAEEALLVAARSVTGGGFVIPLNDKLNYTLADKRSQDIDLYGYSLGLGYETFSSSFSVSFIYQRGQGSTILDKNQLPATSLYTDLSIFLSASNRY
ncbi:MAG: outer membrane protein transport protein [Leptospiraceae bacterium]|nr:outer membrane protein transport protein [Leptospiraceae bacterium]